jgi:hypothetical protein
MPPSGGSAGRSPPICRPSRQRTPRIALQARPRSADRTRLRPQSPKTGVFQMSAGDYRLFRSENAQNRSPETGGQFAKARHWRAFLRVSGTDQMPLDATVVRLAASVVGPPLFSAWILQCTAQCGYGAQLLFFADPLLWNMSHVRYLALSSHLKRFMLLLPYYVSRRDPVVRLDGLDSQCSRARPCAEAPRS